MKSLATKPFDLKAKIVEALQCLSHTVMPTVKNFEDLTVWKDSLKIAVDIYRLTSVGPLARDYSVRDQLRRAVVSISNNIAEGFEYNHNLSFIRFLKYSKGSAGELRSNLRVLKEAELLGEVDHDRLRENLVIISREIEALIKYLRRFESRKKRDMASDSRRPSNLTTF